MTGKKQKNTRLLHKGCHPRVLLSGIQYFQQTKARFPTEFVLGMTDKGSLKWGTCKNDLQVRYEDGQVLKATIRQYRIVQIVEDRHALQAFTTAQNKMINTDRLRGLVG